MLQGNATNDSVYLVATIPPPPGASDAYSAVTRIQQAPLADRAALLRCGEAEEEGIASEAAPLLLDRWLAAAAAVPGDPEMTEAHARALAANLSQHSTGLAAKIHAHLGSAVQLLASPEALHAYGAANLWKLIEVVAARYLERTIDVMAMRAQAVAGTAALEWLAAHGAAGDLTPDESLGHIAASWTAL